MKQKIIKLCKEIEKEENIKILFCVESGSRSWDMASKNSDYDIRFVYVRPLEDYIAIDKRAEVINHAFDKDMNPMKPEGCLIDMVGFDIFKFTKMLSSSNPTVIEWLRSEILYYGERNKVFTEYAEKSFKKISLYFHYKSMCKNNYLKYIRSGDKVTYKRYLYAMRGLVNAKFIVNAGMLPPISFPHTLNASWEFIDNNIIHTLKEIIGLKKEGEEKDIVQNMVKIDNYIESFLKDDSEAPREKQLTTKTELDKELKNILLMGNN